MFGAQSLLTSFFSAACGVSSSSGQGFPGTTQDYKQGTTLMESGTKVKFVRAGDGDVLPRAGDSAQCKALSWKLINCNVLITLFKNKVLHQHIAAGHRA